MQLPDEQKNCMGCSKLSEMMQWRFWISTPMKFNERGTPLVASMHNYKVFFR